MQGAVRLFTESDEKKVVDSSETTHAAFQILTELEDTLRLTPFFNGADAREFHDSAAAWIGDQWETLADALFDRATTAATAGQQQEEEEEDRPCAMKATATLPSPRQTGELLRFARLALVHALQRTTTRGEASWPTDRRCTLAHSILNVDHELVQHKKNSLAHRNPTRSLGADDAASTTADFERWIWAPYLEQKTQRKLLLKKGGPPVARTALLAELACVLTGLEYAWSDLTTVLQNLDASLPPRRLTEQWCWFGKQLQRAYDECHANLGASKKQSDMLHDDIHEAYERMEGDPIFLEHCRGLPAPPSAGTTSTTTSSDTSRSGL